MREVFCWIGDQFNPAILAGPLEPGVAPMLHTFSAASIEAARILAEGGCEISHQTAREVLGWNVPE